MLFVFQTFFTEKVAGKLKIFSPLLEPKVKILKERLKVVKKVYIFHRYFQ